MTLTGVGNIFLSFDFLDAVLLCR